MSTQHSIVAFLFFNIVIMTANSPPLFAHPGGLNAQGCHNNRKTGGYHCHRSPSVNSVAAPAVKLSRNGICHDRSSRSYAQTLYFTAFTNLEDCLNAGGRLPKN